MTDALHLHAQDNVAILLRDCSAGEIMCGTALHADIPNGHKFALRPIAAGEAVLKYGAIIGFAVADIGAGQHVHDHNVVLADAPPAAISAPVATPVKQTVSGAAIGTSFQGFHRADGGIGTRNYIGILTSVNCSATVAQAIAAHFTVERLADFPNVDGVVALAHRSGCGMAKDGEGLTVLRRTLTGYAAHPNFAGVLVIGLGCEVNQPNDLLAQLPDDAPSPFGHISIQEAGGTRNAVALGIAQVSAFLPIANRAVRSAAPLHALVIGLQCGGSDAYSAITANPALGVAVDLLIDAGASAMLSETPEIVGAEHLLFARASTPAVAEKLRARLVWWRDYTRDTPGGLDNNPSPGNRAGGITTIWEKSMGAVAKSGTRSFVDVTEYAERSAQRGLIFMDSPGYDPVSATGQIAAGANLLCFTTGRGAVFGSVPSPCLKLSTTTDLYQRMPEDIDINCGDVIEPGGSLDAKGHEIAQRIVSVASGEKTASEMNGFGAAEFNPWVIGATF
jgi:altronate hydrolase